jgi:hypothetical protein
VRADFGCACFQSAFRLFEIQGGRGQGRAAKLHRN